MDVNVEIIHRDIVVKTELSQMPGTEYKRIK